MAAAFELHRAADQSGVSGIGLVAEGVVFADGTTVLRWVGERASTTVWSNLADALDVHVVSHPTNGSTLRWLEGPAWDHDDCAEFVRACTPQPAPERT